MTPFKSAAVAQAFNRYPGTMSAAGPTDALRLCVAAALTCHSTRQQR